MTLSAASFARLAITFVAGAVMAIGLMRLQSAGKFQLYSGKLPIGALHTGPTDLQETVFRLNSSTGKTWYLFYFQPTGEYEWVAVGQPK